MAEEADPFHPYFPTFPHDQSTTTSPGESSTPMKTIPYWRALLTSEIGLEYSLQKLPPELSDKFRKLNEEGKAIIACQEHSDWRKAEKCFLDSRAMIMGSRKVPDQIEKRTYNILLASIDLLLAQLYQSQGGADMLELAMDMRREVLDCVLPLQSIHSELLVRVCKTYYFTARYEWGVFKSDSEAKREAIRDYAEILMCTEDEAEPQLCFLLAVDYEYSPVTTSSENSDTPGLFWIQEANRLGKKNAGNHKYFFLAYEAKLLMRLGKNSEAVILLRNMSNILAQDSAGSIEYVLNGDHSKLLPEVQKMLQECYAQMGSMASCMGDCQQANEGLAVKPQPALQSGAEEGYWSMKLPLTREADQFYELPASHPMMTRIPPFIGSSLGLLTADDNFRNIELSKLPGPISKIIHSHMRSAADQRTQCDWQRVTDYIEQIRGLLKITKRLVDKKTYNWLISFFDIQLAPLYQHHLRRFGEAIKVWHEIMDCVRDEITGSDHEYLTRGYKMLFDAAMYECDPSRQVRKDSSHRVRNTFLVYTTRIHDSLFWLYFSQAQNWNLEDALRWLRESKWVNDEWCSNAGISEKQCSTDSYFCCDYAYLHAEADLLMKLGKFEEAIIVLEKLLNTKHVQEGSPMLGRQAKKWLSFCHFKQTLSGCTYDEEFVKELRNALELSLPVDNHEVHVDSDEIMEQLPSQVGYILDRSDTIKDTKLIQFKAGLEQHLHKLPVPFQLAIRKHSDHGRIHLERDEWDNAIFEFEWCREILRGIKVQLVMVPEILKTCDWLLVWVSIPLINIYHFQTKEFKKAFHLRLEVDLMIPNGSPNEFPRRIRSYTEILVALYQCSISDYPNLKNAVIKSVRVQQLNGLLSTDSENHVEVAGAPPNIEWATEDWLLRVLQATYFVHGNFEVALQFVRQRRQLFEQWFSGHEHDLRRADHVFKEYECLRRLRRDDDALAVLEDYHRRTNLKKSELPETIQLAFRIMCTSDKGIIGDGLLMKHSVEHAYVPVEYSEKISELRIESGKYVKDEKYVKAIECEKLCGELLNKIQNGGVQEVASDSYHRQLGLHHWRLASLHMLAFNDKVLALYQSQPPFDSFSSSIKDKVKAFQEDVDFTSAVQHFKTRNAIASSLHEPHSVAIGDFLLATLYVLVDEIYCYYFDSFWAKLGQSGRENATSSNMMLDILKEMQSYLTVKTPIQEYGEKAANGYANLLKNMAESRLYSEGWIELLERHKSLYSGLQKYHYRQARYVSLYFTYYSQHFSTNLAVPANLEERIQVYLWNAFLYAEGERTRLMLYQIGSHKINLKQQWGFDATNHRTLEVIREDCASLLSGGSVFVQYSSATLDMTCIFIYVINQGSLSAQMVELPTCGKRSFQQILDDLYNYLEPGKKSKKKRKSYDVNSMNKDLETLYDVLIRPIAHHLADMKPEHKLIFSPSELLTKVPFGALKDKIDQQYLIEKHTIALTSSLRVLQVCIERLQELQKSPHYTGFGSVVALGDPTYDSCKICKGRVRLEGTSTEVEHIVRLFGETTVVKLLRDDATVDQLLHWTTKPSVHESFRQAIVHIGAHGVINEKNHRESVIQLACPICPAASSSEDDDNLSKTKAAASERPLGSRGEPNASNNPSDDPSEEDVSDGDDDDNTKVTSNNILKPIDSFKTTITESIFMYTSSESTCHAASSSDVTSIGGRGDTSTGRINVGSHDLRVEDVTISETRWKAELVVLSACRTSRGRITAEGVLSMARSFIIAGVPCVVASLWNVEDNATLALMEVFYNELVKGSDVSSALRSSMLHRIHMSPGHRAAVAEWASFNVWGVPSLRIPNELQLQRPVNESDSSVDLKNLPTQRKEVGDLEGSANINVGESSSSVRQEVSAEDSEIANNSTIPTTNSVSYGFRLDQENGVCMRMAARRMTIMWSDDRRYWDWIPDQNSLFSEVALLKAVCWFEARGEIDCSTLPLGNYTFSWRIHLTNVNMNNNGWHFEPAHFTLSKNSTEDIECKCFMSTYPEVSGQPIGQVRLPTIRIMENGWREYDVGEFSVLEGDDSCVLKFAMKAMDPKWKFGLCMDGIVIRPRSSSMPHER